MRDGGRVGHEEDGLLPDVPRGGLDAAVVPCGVASETDPGFHRAVSHGSMSDNGQVSRR
jgi:hypothetical protein